MVVTRKGRGRKSTLKSVKSATGVGGVKSKKTLGGAKKGGAKTPTRETTLKWVSVSRPTRDIGVTELARVKHYILGGILQEEPRLWIGHFGTYICEEQHPECKLPFLEAEGELMVDNVYFPYSRIYSLSLFHLNIHKRCTLSTPVTCHMMKCDDGVTFTKADVFLAHLEQQHTDYYTYFWNNSKFAFKPNCKQFLYGMHYVSFDNCDQSVCRWACVVCRQTFERPEDWQNHRQHRKLCSKQVVEVLYNKHDIKPEQLSDKLWSDDPVFCGICSHDEEIHDARESFNYDSSASKQNTTGSSEADNLDAELFLTAGSREKVVVHGSLREIINHICEKHTHKAFVCLSCDRALAINSKKHFVNCLQCTEEGLSMSNIRKFKVSKQIMMWTNHLIEELTKAQKITKVTVKGQGQSVSSLTSSRKHK
ncbi:uncharacterized protein LOC142336476 isoform X2 [Convolutriloba macropyga]|uniref:uncharacterized protein LOC142336476 isoform X2 n=1 Tax=Convolutriloba macropyga TaxID=536237 RepID=UPI003F523BDA